MLLGIIAVLLGTITTILNLRDIIKKKKEGRDEGLFDRALVIKGIGLIILGVILITWSFTGYI